MSALTFHTYKDREEWLAARQAGVGASEVAAALGLSQYKSPFSLWSEKVLGATVNESERMSWGSLLEPVIANEWARRNNVKIEDPGRNCIAWSDEAAPLFATLDRVILDDERGYGALEIKASGEHMASQWEDNPPLMYQVQLQAQLAVTGYQWGVIAALLGGQELRSFTIDRDDNFIAQMRLSVSEFWGKVVSKTPPAIDSSESTADAIKRMFPREDGREVDLPISVTTDIDEIMRHKATIKSCGQLVSEAEARIKMLLGEASVGLVPGGGKVTWKTTERSGYEVKPTSFRQFRIVAP